MKKLLSVLPLLLLLGACTGTADPSQVNTTGAVRNVLADLDRQEAQGVDTRANRFECAGIGSVVVSYRLPKNETTAVAIVTTDGGNGPSRTLKQIVSGSGARYSDGRSEWSTKGPSGILSLDGGKDMSCRLIKKG